MDLDKLFLVLAKLADSLVLKHTTEHIGETACRAAKGFAEGIDLCGHHDASSMEHLQVAHQGS